MIGLDLGAFPPEIAKLLLLRGASLPPVLWGSEGLRLGKKTLDTLEDQTLFANPIVDEEMSTAVRSLLYLWCGWLADCVMFSQGAAEPERLYLLSICDRHQNRFAEAKSRLKQLGSHPIYPELATYALSTASGSADPSVRRLREMLQQDTHWEPYLFCDAVAQACAGKMNPAGENFVRQVQCREFELLLTYCFEKAVGCKLTQHVCAEPSESARRAAERERRMREERRRREEKRRRDEFASRTNASPTSSSRPEAPAPSKPVEQSIGVICPKCGHTQQVGIAARGKPAQCGKCGTGFMVPNSGSVASVGRTAPAGPESAASAGVLTVLCPKCAKRLALSATARGKKATCTQCGASFLVPQLQSAASH